MPDSSSSAPEWSNPYAPPAVPFSEPPVAPEPEKALEPVKFGRRACARLLDLGAHIVLGGGVGIFIGTVAVLVAMSRNIPLDDQLQAAIQPEDWATWVAGIVGSLLFQTICEGWHGCSLGKRMLGIVVLQENGSPCTPFQALKREIAFFVDSLFFGIVAASRMSEENRQQRMGDSWAGTVVVFRRSAPARSLRSGSRFAIVLLLALLADAAALAVPFLFQIARM